MQRVTLSDLTGSQFCSGGTIKKHASICGMTFHYNVIILALQRNMWRHHNTRSMSLTVQSWVNAFLVQVFQRVDSTNHWFRSIETMIRETPTGVWQKFNKGMNTVKVREDKDTMPVHEKRTNYPAQRKKSEIICSLQVAVYDSRFSNPFAKRYVSGVQLYSLVFLYETIKKKKKTF